jgi:hypothetical protein
MEQRGLSPFNVVATFADMTQARHALDVLEGAGIEAAQISLLGPRVEQAAEEQDTGQRDRAMATDVAKHVGVGAAAGSAAGGALGFLAGAAAFGIPGVGPVVGMGIWATTAGGAFAGATVGGMVGGVAKLDMHPDWELTYQDVKRGRVVVAFHAPDEDEAAQGAELLSRAEPLRVERFDGTGKRF